jgi:DNA polymerase I-like protein with 3'-5' exonuclease and polymerase domains
LKYFDGSTIKTPFNREIESDEFHAINYLLQSTTSDIFQESVHRIFQLLQNSNSCVAFAVHDSVVLDFSKQDTGLLRGLIKQFSKTRFGEYPCNLSIGKNFLNMEAIESV